MEVELLEVFGVERQVRKSSDFVHLREAESLRHKLQKERKGVEATFFILEVKTPPEPFFEEGTQIGWIPKLSKYRLYEVIGDLKLSVEIALCLGFRPASYASDTVDLRNEICELLAKLECRSGLRLGEVTDSYIKLHICQGVIPDTDVKKVLDFDKRKFDARFSGIGIGNYRNVFLQGGFLLIGAEF